MFQGYRITANEWDAFPMDHLHLPGAVFATTFRYGAWRSFLHPARPFKRECSLVVLQLQNWTVSLFSFLLTIGCCSDNNPSGTSLGALPGCADIRWIDGTANIGSSTWSIAMGPDRTNRVHHSTSEYISATKHKTVMRTTVRGQVGCSVVLPRWGGGWVSVAETLCAPRPSEVSARESGGLCTALCVRRRPGSQRNALFCCEMQEMA